jgi:hypothetical protein
MRLPVHRWFRFSAGFSALWAKSVIAEAANKGEARVLDPFAGSGTTLLVAEDAGVPCYGVEAHPFVARVARAKLSRRSDPGAFLRHVELVRLRATQRPGSLEQYPDLIRRCYEDGALLQLDQLRQSVLEYHSDCAAAELAWLTLVSVLRTTSRAGTAPWQYVLPNKSKKRVKMPFDAFEKQARMVFEDMVASQGRIGQAAELVQSDARTCEGIPDEFATLVLTSPPYPNNFDYADATRLEMTFMGEVSGWGDLQRVVRQHLIRACSQHVPERAVNLDSVLTSSELAPIRADLAEVTGQLADIRMTKGGRKTYHLMVACYFLDLAKVFIALRRATARRSTICFVIGDSAPYGVHVPAPEWLGQLACAAGFAGFRFEHVRDRNIKWKNRKHRVPLCEGRLWIEG